MRTNPRGNGAGGGLKDATDVDIDIDIAPSSLAAADEGDDEAAEGTEVAAAVAAIVGLLSFALLPPSVTYDPVSLAEAVLGGRGDD